MMSSRRRIHPYRDHPLNDPEPDPRKRFLRKRFLGLPGEACGYCRLSSRSHLDEQLYCPEWALRASDGDR